MSLSLRHHVVLKLCLVLATLSLSVACPGTTTGQALQIADGWAQRVCKLVNAFPAASSSALPPNVTINVAITPSAAVAVASETAPDAGVDAPTDVTVMMAVSAFKIPLPVATADAGSEVGAP